MCDNAPLRLLDRLNNALLVPGNDGLQINDLARNAVCLSHLCCLSKPLQLRSPPNERYIGTFPHDVGFADWSSKSPNGTSSTADLYKIFGSMKIVGSGDRM